MNNRIIKSQWPENNDKTYANLYLSSKCLPFDKTPFYFNPKGHVSNIYDLFECIDYQKRLPELLARKIENNTNRNGQIYTPIEELKQYGEIDQIKQLINEYNKELYEGFKPGLELSIYNNYIYIKENESKTADILNKLKELAEEKPENIESFSDEQINRLKFDTENMVLDDPEKEKILAAMFKQSKVHMVYGAAGTGKTTLINYVSTLMYEKRKLFLAKTNPAVENLRRKVGSGENKEFATINSFLKSSYYKRQNYDLIIVDECSTVKNDEILEILNRLDESVIVLVGDTYQIEAIGFGNWFSLAKKIMPSYCNHELLVPHRSTDVYLKKLWDEVRNMNDDNVVLERTVRSEYSNPIDSSIFQKKSKDEIILCLNYNGLYGLNNINKLLQLGNPNEAVNIGIWNFKIGDPILFNDSGRFEILYNNLKGIILDIEDNKEYVYFTIEIDLEISKRDVLFVEGLDVITEMENKTIIGFKVNRRAPYSSDDEPTGDEHIIPFQIAYAVSIHKSQGLEYDSVKIVIANDTENLIKHNIFYTAITRARNNLTIYWSPEVCNRILDRIRPDKYEKEFYIMKAKGLIAEI